MRSRHYVLGVSLNRFGLLQRIGVSDHTVKTKLVSHLSAYTDA